MSAPAVVNALEGPLAPPRANGELVFEAPWQGRAFGLAVALCERGCFAWERFREELVRAIAAPDPQADYYESWLAALTAVLLDEGVLDAADLHRRVGEIASGIRDEIH